MSRKYKLDYLRTQNVVTYISPAVKIVEGYNSMLKPISANLINKQLLNMAQPILEVYKGWDKIYDYAGISRKIAEPTYRINELINSTGMIELNSAMHDILASTTLLQQRMDSMFKGMNSGFNHTTIKTIQGLAIDVPRVQEEIQRNLNIFRNIDWSEIIELQDLEEFDIDNSLDELTVDVVDGIRFQQQIVEFANKFKVKYPAIFYLILVFVWSPIQSAINDEVLNIIKGTTAPIVREVKTTNYNRVEKNIKIEVNNVLNINIESKEVKDDVFKKFGYVATDKLVMRQGNGIKTKPVYTLEFGQVVKIIHKNRNWTLVEYEIDENFIQGWVFTRYISKFKK